MGLTPCRKRAQEIGLSLDEIGDLLATGGAAEYRKVRDLLRAKLDDFDTTGAERAPVKLSSSPGQRICPGCGGASRSVARRTVLLMLKPSLLDQVNEGSWRFCPGADCRVVYSAEDGNAVFTTDDLRVRVGPMLFGILALVALGLTLPAPLKNLLDQIVRGVSR